MILDETTRRKIKEKFDAELKDDVQITLFASDLITGDGSEDFAAYTKDLVRELSELSGKIKIVYEGMHGEEAKKSNITVSPSIILGNGRGKPLVQYFGAPAGYEAGSFVEAISMISRNESGLDLSSKEKLKYIDRDTLIETYVTPGCPHCPNAVILSNRIAVETDGIVIARCIEAQEMMERAIKFNVSSVPQQVINEEEASITIGVQQEKTLVNAVLTYGSSKGQEIVAKDEEEWKRRTALSDNPDYPLVITDGNIEEAVAKYSFLVVDCWAPWCAPCRMLAPAIENLASSRKGDIVFGKLDVDENPETSEKFAIRSIPNLIVFKKGKKVGDIVGAMNEEALLEKINAYR